jgi:hypothetical protein
MGKLFQFFEEFLLCTENGIIQRNHGLSYLVKRANQGILFAGNID